MVLAPGIGIGIPFDNLLGAGGIPTPANGLLAENGDFLLAENGDFLIQE